VKKENEKIDQHVEQILKKSAIAKDFNNSLILQMKAYNQLLKNELYPLTLKGISTNYLSKIKQDISGFR